MSNQLDQIVWAYSQEVSLSFMLVKGGQSGLCDGGRRGVKEFLGAKQGGEDQGVGTAVAVHCTVQCECPS